MLKCLCANPAKLKDCTTFGAHLDTPAHSSSRLERQRMARGLEKRLDSGYDVHHAFLYPLLGDPQSPSHPHRCSGLVDRPLRWPSLGDTGGEEQINHETPLVQAGLPSAAPAAFPSSPPSPSSVLLTPCPGRAPLCPGWRVASTEMAPQRPIMAPSTSRQSQSHKPFLCS